MSVNEKGNLRPDGISLELPFGPIALGGTYYWNPGALPAPKFTLTGGVGQGGGGVHLIHLRRGMSSEDTLRYGASVNVPSFNVNATIPDDSGVPLPWKAKVSSIGIGAGFPGVSANFTATPQQIAAFIRKYVLTPIMGSTDQSAAPGGMPQSLPIRMQPGAERPMPYAGYSAGSAPFGAGISPWFSDYADVREPPARAVSGGRSDRVFFDGASAVPYIKDERATLGAPSAASVMSGGSGASGPVGSTGSGTRPFRPAMRCECSDQLTSAASRVYYASWAGVVTEGRRASICKVGLASDARHGCEGGESSGIRTRNGTSSVQRKRHRSPHCACDRSERPASESLVGSM
ncbi:hypothetical protein ACVILH_003341 [Bradyrhizobium sp. USDA 4353]